MRDKIRSVLPFAKPYTRQTVHGRDAMKMLAGAKAANRSAASSPTQTGDDPQPKWKHCTDQARPVP